MEKAPNAFSKCFSERLYRLRQDKGLNQTQLAAALKVSRSAIAFYENGQRTPDIAFLARVGNYFGVSCDYLLGKEIYSKPEYTQIVRRLGLWDKNIDLLMTLDNDINKAKANATADGQSSPSDTLNLLNLFIFVFFKGIGSKKNTLPGSIEQYLTYSSGGKAKNMAQKLMAGSLGTPTNGDETDKIETALIAYAKKEMTDAFLAVIEGMKEEYLLKKKMP
jgi:transcriptional regulator with XRE-family HTH domain